MTTRRILVTGGAGFIGSAVARLAAADPNTKILVVDKLTYAGNRASLDPAFATGRLEFIQADICDAHSMRAAFDRFAPDAILHLAAETHVDRSIDSSAEFVRTNVVGTHVLLCAALDHWRAAGRRENFRFLHVSTDEVYGHLGPHGRFHEGSSYRPRSPYSASKASSDHLARAWYETYSLPVIVTNCSNNYGPYQFPEKLIPLTVLNAIHGQRLPVYGKGTNVRDWLFVDDHARALLALAEKGRPGETYNIGAECERQNIDVVRTICSILDEIGPGEQRRPHEQLIEFVSDRPGHDERYAIDPSKVRREIGWEPVETFESGLRSTVRWYLQNRAWWEPLRTGVYGGERLGSLVNP
jgi:dTDP-glucose 4,6-dehydratase